MTKDADDVPDAPDVCAAASRPVEGMYRLLLAILLYMLVQFLGNPMMVSWKLGFGTHCFAASTALLML